VRLVRLARTLVRKARNLLFYKLSLIAQQASLRLRTSVLEKVLQSGESWPQTVQPLTVAEIYTYLESRYQPPVLADSIVLLVRATSGRDNDRPFREVYSEEDFGWGQVARRLEIADVHGGHSSMLQEDQVRELADLIAAKLPPVP
jgi:thioesterase domain-containing protein